MVSEYRHGIHPLVNYIHVYVNNVSSMISNGEQNIKYHFTIHGHKAHSEYLCFLSCSLMASISLCV